jgi:hypothetical protein
MSAQAPGKPVLIPVKAPWRISTTWGASLSVESCEDRAERPTFVEFVGAFARHEAKSRSGSKPSVSIEPFLEISAPPTAPYHLVRVIFEHGCWTQLSPSVSETETVREEDYDWSALPTVMLPGETLHENLARTRKLWLASGTCPNPGMYEVQFSPWLASLGLASQPKWKHYLLLGSDGYVEIIAQGWEWKLGQPVSGR